MKGTFSRTLFLPILLLFLPAIACGWFSSATPLPPTPTSPPAALLSENTPAVSAPVPALLPVNELEAQVQAVYDLSSPGVVNITSRTIAYDFFFNPYPREGSGSGFI